ncbi:hypothetical protein B840_08995 [Corynebacterium marinum DSM 44953]|uniref:Glycosyl transferase family 1 domain-containing protein n=2 Tax=Corynebacterium marinum TaxID=349751 RepID=A0A0B6THI4_9CORY|nr:hypothetical protein B840_08995 [Corynebacterium marinum DSM 44953]
MRTLELIEQSTDKNVQHYICVSSGRKGTLDDRYLNAGASVEYLKLKSILFPFKFYVFLKNNSLDVVHSNLMYVSGLVLLIAKLARIPVRISQFQSDGVPDHRLSIIQKAKRLLLKELIGFSSTKIVGLTPENLIVAWTSKWKSDPRCEVVPNGVDSENIEITSPTPFGRYKDTTVIIHVGRGDLPTKNRAKAISVFSTYFRNYNDNSILVFVGRDGKDASQARANRSKLDLQIEELGISKNVLFLGERSDVRNLLLASDVFLFTSTLEGLPGVVLEALASGLPILSTDLPGVKFLKEYFPEIRLIDSTRPDDEWCKILQKFDRKLEKRDRLEAVQKFRESPFELSKAVERYLDLWRK